MQLGGRRFLEGVGSRGLSHRGGVLQIDQDELGDLHHSHQKVLNLVLDVPQGAFWAGWANIGEVLKLKVHEGLAELGGE